MRNLILAVILVVPALAVAHEGKTDEKGGHADAAGVYHCHEEGCEAAPKPDDDEVKPVKHRRRPVTQGTPRPEPSPTPKTEGAKVEL